MKEREPRNRGPVEDDTIFAPAPPVEKNGGAASENGAGTPPAAGCMEEVLDTLSTRQRPPGAIDEFWETFTKREDVDVILKAWAK